MVEIHRLYALRLKSREPLWSVFLFVYGSGIDMALIVYRITSIMQIYSVQVNQVSISISSGETKENQGGLEDFSLSLHSPCLSNFFLCMSCWKYALIQPVLYKDDRSRPTNYRPIELISCLSKVFQSAVFFTAKFENTLRLATFFLIVSMDFAKGTLLVIF